MTQTELLKQHFDSGRSLTVLTAIQKYGIYALSQRVGQLIRQGYPIHKDWLDLPNGKTVRSYSKARV